MEKLVIVHHVEHVISALRIAVQHRKTVHLQNAPYSASYAGALYLKKMVGQAAARVPEATYIFTMDCGNDISAFWAALRSGHTRIRFQGAAEVYNKLSAIAAENNVLLHNTAYKALDLHNLHLPEKKLAEWLL